MCVITICTIFKCWHLEAILQVTRCPKATAQKIRHCNRECSPPELIGKFSDSPCSLCVPNRAANPDSDSNAIPVYNPRDATFLDYFRLNNPLTHQFSFTAQNANGIDRFIRDDWVEPIHNAHEMTLCKQAEVLDEWFGYFSSTNQERINWGNNVEMNPIDMEVLTILPCGGSVERCPGPHPEPYRPYDSPRTVFPYNDDEEEEEEEEEGSRPAYVRPVNPPQRNPRPHHHPHPLRSHPAVQDDWYPAYVAQLEPPPTEDEDEGGDEDVEEWFDVPLGDDHQAGVGGLPSPPLTPPPPPTSSQSQPQSGLPLLLLTAPQQYQYQTTPDTHLSPFFQSPFPPLSASTLPTTTPFPFPFLTPQPAPPLLTLLNSPPLPLTDLAIVDRWVYIARSVPGAHTAGVQYMLPALVEARLERWWERERAVRDGELEVEEGGIFEDGGEVDIGVRVLLSVFEDAGVDLDWVVENGLYPDWLDAEGEDEGVEVVVGEVEEVEEVEGQVRDVEVVEGWVREVEAEIEAELIDSDEEDDEIR